MYWKSMTAIKDDRIDQLKTHFAAFAGFVVTTKTTNTAEWMKLLVDRLNLVSAELDDKDRFFFDGEWIRRND